MRQHIVIAFASVMAVCMLAMPVPVAYASVEGATLSSGENSVAADYLSLGMYAYRNYETEQDISEVAFSESLFDPTAQAVFNTGRMTYSAGSAYNEVKSTFRMTPVNLYLAVLGTTGTYYLNGDDVTVTVSGFPQDATVTSTLSFGLREYDSDNGRWTLQGGTAYYLALNVYVECRYTPATDPEPTITVSIAALYETVSSSYREVSMPITLTQSGIIEEVIHENGDSNIIVDSSDPSVQYTIVVSETEVSNGTEYSTISLTNGTDDGYLLDLQPQGNTHMDVNFSLDIPAGKEFAINLRSTSKSATFDLEVSMYDSSGVRVDHYTGGTFTLNGNKSYYYTPGSYGSIRTNSSFQPDSNGWTWFSNDTDGPITISVSGNAGYGVKVLFVFNNA